jgi:hypothetical protein
MLEVVDDARAGAVGGHAAWSESFNEMFMQAAAHDALARYVVSAMGDPAAVLAVDETGFLRKASLSWRSSAAGHLVPSRSPSWGPPGRRQGTPPLKRGPDTCGQRLTPPRTYAPPAFVKVGNGRDLIPFTAAEARRLFSHPLHPARRNRQRWSGWRRRRQAAARKSHYARRLRNHKALL